MNYLTVMYDNYEETGSVLSVSKTKKDFIPLVRKDIIDTSSVGSDDTFIQLLKTDVPLSFFKQRKSEDDEDYERRLYEFLSELTEDDGVLMEQTSYGYYEDVINFYLEETNSDEDFDDVRDQFFDDEDFFGKWLEKWLKTVL